METSGGQEDRNAGKGRGSRKRGSTESDRAEADEQEDRSDLHVNVVLIREWPLPSATEAVRA